MIDKASFQDPGQDPGTATNRLGAEPFIHPSASLRDSRLGKLLHIGWWDWPRDRLAAALADICALTAEEFCARHGNAAG